MVIDPLDMTIVTAIKPGRISALWYIEGLQHSATPKADSHAKVTHRLLALVPCRRQPFHFCHTADVSGELIQHESMDHERGPGETRHFRDRVYAEKWARHSQQFVVEIETRC